MGSFKARLPRPSGIREYSEKNSPVELVAFMDVEMQLFAPCTPCFRGSQLRILCSGRRDGFGIGGTVSRASTVEKSSNCQLAVESCR